MFLYKKIYFFILDVLYYIQKGWYVMIELRLKKLLKEKNTTQNELSEKTGIPQPYISAMCNNQKCSIHRVNLYKIAVALNVEDINELITYKKPLQ